MRARAHQRYNLFYSCHAKSRSVVERAIGLWKMRWLILKKGLRVKSTTYAAEIIKSTGYLHNFLIENRLLEEIDDELFDDNVEPNDEEQENDQENEINGGFNFVFNQFRMANNLDE